MSNIVGKTLLGAKKLGGIVGKSATEIGTVISGVAVEVGGQAKKAAKISMIKAEMENLYFVLGSVVFEGGLTPDNEKAMEIMNSLYTLNADLVELEKQEKTNDCSCGDDCNCGGNCSCGDDCKCDGGCHCHETDGDNDNTEDTEN